MIRKWVFLFIIDTITHYTFWLEDPYGYGFHPQY